MSKYLGQHFLKDKNKVEIIIKALEISEGDFIIEIGPGKGALTRKLISVDKSIELVGVEKDKKLAKKLKKRLDSDEIKIKEGDILKVLPSLANKINKEYKIIGNIPYYITGQLFRVLSGLKNKPVKIVLTVQREVAQRVASRPPKMNKLAASVQVWGEVNIIDYISKECFVPVPKVDSAVIKVVPFENRVNEKYYKVMRAVFKHPRKTVLNNLYLGLDIDKEKLKNVLTKINVPKNARPQELNIKNIKKMSIML